MKKFFLFGAMAATLFSFCACEVEEVIDDVAQEVTGEASFTISQNGVNETLNFTSAITDAYVKDSSVDLSRATVAVCANVSLTSSDSQLDFPYVAFQFDGESTGIMNCHTILTQDLLSDFSYESVKSLLQSPDGANFLMLGKKIGTDTAWYVSDSGSINVNVYPTMGNELEGSVTNMKMLYFTTSQLEANKDAISEAIENGTFDIHNFTTSCYISGTFKCRRTAIIQDILNALRNDGVIE